MIALRFSIFAVSILTFYSCSTDKKEKLVDTFKAFVARDIPANIFMLDKLNAFDLLKQKQETINESYNYPKTFVVGLFDEKTKNYERAHVIDGFSPTSNYKLVEAASDYYSSDTTYLDNIQLTDTINLDNKDVPSLKDTLYRISKNDMQSSFKMDGKKYIVLIYRKTNPLKDTGIGKWAMWKREIIQVVNNKLETTPVDRMNEHLF